jgi:hypothetical protein
MPKATTCIVNGESIEIGAALEMRSGKTPADLRCVECDEPVRTHKKGTTGQKAHFEHATANPGCSLSTRRRR